MNGELLKLLGEYLGIIGVMIWIVLDNLKRRKEIKQTPTDNTLVAELFKNYEDTNNKEHTKLLDLLERGQLNFEEIRTDIGDIFLRLSADAKLVNIKKAHAEEIRAKIAEALPYFNDEKLRHFVVIQCNEFSNWVLSSSKYIFQDAQSLQLSIQQLQTTCEGLRTQCPSHLSKDICDQYFVLKSIDLEKYLIKVRKIFDDRVNDKVNKFMSTSILYMQDFISLLLHVYIESLDPQKKAAWEKTDIDGLSEMRRIEKKTKKLI